MEDTTGQCPYKGLMPYTEKDAAFFFGRERDQRLIIANLFAARLTMFYGASGVGKTSVLQAGAAYHLRQRDELVIVVFNAWSGDPVVGLKQAVANEIKRLLKEPMPVPESLSLVDFLAQGVTRLDGRLMIILDQFEEYFLYHPQEDGEGTFAVQFPRAVNRLDLRVSFLVSIREDSLAKLDRFKGRIPNLFDNYLRIEHLDREAARAAIEKPVEQYNLLRKTNVCVEPTLVKAVLDQVRTGQVVLSEAGRGVVRADIKPAPAEMRIETPYLQLVMTRLWDEEMRTGSRVLRLETLDRLGGAQHIVRTHLDAALGALPPSEQDVTARVFHNLVTPSGTKIAHTVPDLAEYAELPQRQVAIVLDKLSGPDVRILRPVAPPPDQPNASRYEIFHDVLAPAILDWRARHVKAQYVSSIGIILITAYLILLSILLYGLVQFWPPSIPASVSAPTSLPVVTFLFWTFRISDEVRLIFIVALAGALGGLIRATESLYWYVGKRALERRWVAESVLLPFVGTTLGLVFYFVIRAGFFSPQAPVQETNPFGFAALAILVGMFSEQIVVKLREVTETLLAKPSAGEDSIPQE
jgi:hypothetical protein